MCVRHLLTHLLRISAKKETNYKMEETYKMSDTISARVISRINISEGKKYLTQRDNKIRPFATCNTTSIIMALVYSGQELPPKVHEEDQYEDILTAFLQTNEEVAKYYAKIDPVNYREWVTSPSSLKVIPPNEYHAVLAFGTNLWLGRRAVSFSTSTPVNKIIFSLLQGKAVVLSGKWAGLKHIVCAVGFTTQQQDIDSVTSPQDIDLSLISDIIIDDPFGDYTSKYQNTDGNDIHVPTLDFISICREYDSGLKWAHMIS